MTVGRALGLMWLSLLPVAAQSSDQEYLQQLIRRAGEQQLAQRAEWHNLLHYKRHWLLPGVRSLADDPKFFNAPDGNTNPDAELAATLRVFFSTAPETDRTQNPQCAFIARYRWLKHELDFDPARLPQRRCARFERWRDSLDPELVTLVFPVAYLNNPASAYGHTLLRIDARNQDERTRLLAYAINYAAVTDDTNGVVFAVRGLFGGYPGLFAIGPYYVKVAEYNDLENRDIWEYQLNFDPDEIDRLLMHVWELGPIKFDYYFLDENCSYHLLSLFEVARPGLHLTDRFRAWAIPADTVRAVVEQQGLLRKVTYRPARSTVLRHRQSDISAEHVDLAKALAHGRVGHDAALPALTAQDRARVLELAFEYLEYQRISGASAKLEPAETTAARLRALLLARSEIDADPPPPVPMPAARPDQGHGSARAGIGAGSEAGRRFQEFRFRPAYHDLLDPEEGYTRGSHIEFFDISLRHTDGQHGVRLERFDLLKIASLAPRDRLLTPMSWNVDAAFRRKRFPDGSRRVVFGLSGGPGVTYESSLNALFYGFVEAGVDVSRRFDDTFALGLGPAVGVLAAPAPAFRFNLYARSLRYGLGDAHNAREIRMTPAYVPGRQFELRLELSRVREFEHVRNSAAVHWLVYF